MRHLSRRRFAQFAGSAVLAVPPAFAQRASLTAQQLAERIQRNLGAPWQPPGDLTTPVKGIATTAMATMDVLTRAAKANINLIVTLEPTFFGHLDAQPASNPNDPVYLAKKTFIEKSALMVWRFTDPWRARKPDPFATGLANTLDWRKHQVADDVLHYDLPAGTLAALAKTLQQRLKARAGIRVLGDPQTRIRRVALLPGISPLAATMKNLPDADVIVAGETREWESVEYAADTVASGQKKGFVMLGRILSEDPGMKVCAEWLKALAPEVPVQWLPTGDPYWRPA
jgi:putative NIF3 family GTP cyclohydrolase 1 type 2